jgi:hypothetical protein
VPYDDIDKLFFVDCTRITLADGNKTSFWLSGCLQGKRPKDITPHLFDKTTALCQPAQENTVLSPKTNLLWSLSNSKVSSYR